MRRICLVAVYPELAEQRRQLGPHFIGRIAEHHAGGAANDRGDCAIGLFAERRTGGAPHRDIGEAILIAEAGDEFVDEARLADAGFADQANQLRRAATGKIEAVEQARASSLSRPISGALSPSASSPRAARGVSKQSREPMHQYTACLAAQRDVAQQFIGEGVPGQSMRERPDQYLPRAPPSTAAAARCSPCRR